MFALIKSSLLGAVLAVAAVSSSHAATASFVFSSSIIGGPLDGADVGSFQVFYDDSFLVTGNEDLTPASGGVVFGGASAIDTAAVGYPNAPVVSFKDFAPIHMNFLLTSTTFPLLAVLGLEKLWIGGDLATGQLFDFVVDPINSGDVVAYKTFATTTSPSEVPLPAALPLLVGGIGALALGARRRARG